MSTLRCPVDGDELELVILDAIVPITAVGHQCTRCGGVLLGSAGQKRVLGQGLSTAEVEPGHRPSPRTGDPMGRMEAAGIELDVCQSSGEIWFDRGELVVVRGLVQQLLETHKTAPGAVELGPLADLRARCADCDVELTPETGIVDSPIGIVCQTCADGVAFDGFESGAHARSTTLGDAAVEIEHTLGSGYRGRIQVQLDDARGGVAATTLSTPTWWNKVSRLWSRPTDVGQARLDGLYVTRTDDLDALRALLQRRGVVEQLVELAGLGRCEVGFAKATLTAQLTASQDVALRFEHVVRRLAVAYRAL